VRPGLYLSPQHPPGTDPRRAFAEHLEQVALARALGFAAVAVPQHFLAERYQMLQPLPLLARLADEAGEMRLVAGVLLLTLLNPVEVAEQAATMDVLTGGRFVLGVGLGYRAEEDAAFGVGRRRVARFRDRLEVVRRLLDGEEVTAAGEGYRLERARLVLRPDPRPSIWLAGNGDAAVRRAARLGDAWILNPHATVDDLERQRALFVAERGRDAVEVPVVREVCVAQTDAAAERIAAPVLAAKYAAYVDWGQSEVMPEGDTLRRGWDDLRRGRFLVGAPDTVAAGLRELRERVGATLVLARVQWPGLAHADAMRSLTLLGERVIPAI
jgi:alkanesulfonate monooxygenase SsuD/methylene tetrahydromethanopterin reductase-like flavin-dependent oxidoreductase (luciferase family)